MVLHGMHTPHSLPPCSRVLGDGMHHVHHVTLCRYHVIHYAHHVSMFMFSVLLIVARVFIHRVALDNSTSRWYYMVLHGMHYPIPCLPVGRY